MRILGVIVLCFMLSGCVGYWKYRSEVRVAEIEAEADLIKTKIIYAR